MSPDRHEPLLAEYDRLASNLAARGEVIRAHMVDLLAADRSLKIHSITLRLKTRRSLEAKLARPDRTYENLWDVTDIVGIRVITYFEDAVDRVGRIIEAKLPVDFSHSVDKRIARDTESFGYRSLHYVCALAKGNLDGLSEESTLPEVARCEVQVRTVLEHAWAEIEHDLGYKSREAVPAHARRRLNRLAGLLEIVDQEFVTLKNELEHYARTLPERVTSAESHAVSLDRLSLESLLDCEETRTLDDEIAKLIGKEIGKETFFPDYLLRMLDSSGIRTIGEAKDGLVRHRTAIGTIVKPYFAFTEATWHLSPEQLTQAPRGYCLFFLAHVTVLRSPSLGVGKVERLAHLYRQLDYPNDARTAQRVASKLIDAFKESAIFLDD